MTSARLLFGAKSFELKVKEQVQRQSSAFSTKGDIDSSNEQEEEEEDSEGELVSFPSMKSLRSLKTNKQQRQQQQQQQNNDNQQESTLSLSLTLSSSYRPPHAYARMGPNNEGDNMPPFCWKAFSKHLDKRGKVFSHLGQPDCFDFKWQSMPPSLSVSTHWFSS